MKQVIVIHGEDSFLRHRDFIRFLKTIQVTKQDFLPRTGWKNTLPEVLGRGYQVLLPQMPNKFNAKYLEWKIWFEKMRPFTRPNVILVGHSQGGLFLLKYLSENKFPKKIRALFLVAPPHDQSKGIGDFRLKKTLSLVQQQCSTITFFYSTDDPVVPISEMKRFQKELPKAEFITYQNRGHFTLAEFPELVRLIESTP